MLAKTTWLVVSSGQFALNPEGDFFHPNPPLDCQVDLPVGIGDANPLFRVAFAANIAPGSVKLREAFDRVSVENFPLLARACQLEHWWQTHRYCGRCGAKNALFPHELALHCTACDELYYPRISPCIIVLIRRGHECLLAKHARSSINRYSTLAGFIEAGESAEQAVAREVEEEVGICITNIQYVTSQNWPFPSQLMLGFFADYASGQICVDGDEIVDAGWFTIDSLPELSPTGTISRYLIDAFFQALDKPVLDKPALDR